MLFVLAYCALGVLLLWATVVGFIMAALAWHGEMTDAVLADVLGWPVTLVPWREWLRTSQPGTHRLVVN